MATMVPSLFPLETKHSYCNLGFAVLGRVIEVLRRQTFDTVLRERIF
jgi:CubicO group peptidase (beta-lactamase class C family)